MKTDRFTIGASAPLLMCGGVILALVVIFIVAASVGRERAKQSVECVRAGGQWVDGQECQRKP